MFTIASTPIPLRGANASHEQSVHEADSHIPHVILFLALAFATGVATRALIKNVTLLSRVPYTLILLLLGLLVGQLTRHFSQLATYTATLANANPHTILHIFLPVLLFESALDLDSHTFMHSVGSILLLAVPGMCVVALLSGVVVTQVFNYGWSFADGVLFGAVISATDPVAVVALLRDLGTSKQLSVQIEGESLLNDGSAIVLFSVMMDICTGPGQLAVGSVLLKFLRVVLGGSVFGVVCGHVIIFCLTRILNDAVSEITLTIVAAYFTFYVGEVLLGVSGVLAVVFLGLVVNTKKASISPEVERSLHMFWSMLSYLANTVIFILVGIVITEKAAVAFTKQDIVDSVVLYVAVNVIRGVMVTGFFPLLKRLGYGMSWRGGVVLVWSGLRGAVSLAMALMVAHHPALMGPSHDPTSEYMLPGQVGQETAANWTHGTSVESVIQASDDPASQHNKLIGHKTLIHTAALVFLTLTINGTTVRPLLSILGLSTISRAVEQNMAHAINSIVNTKRQILSMLKTDRFMANADWSIVDQLTMINNPFKKSSRQDHSGSKRVNVQLDAGMLSHRVSVCPGFAARVPAETTSAEFMEMVEDARLRYINTERMSYWRQHEHGMISARALEVLVGAADFAADNNGAFIDVDYLSKYWQTDSIFDKMRRKLSVRSNSRENSRFNNQLPSARWRQAIFENVTSHLWFEIFTCLIIVAHMILMLLETTTIFYGGWPYATGLQHDEKDSMYEIGYQTNARLETMLFTANATFLVIYLTEAVLRICGIGLDNYWSSHWNKLDVLVILLMLADVGFDLANLLAHQLTQHTAAQLYQATHNMTATAAAAAAYTISPAVIRNVRLLRLFKAAKLFRLFKPIIPRLSSFLHKQTNQKLLLGYDIGKGYIVGEEEVVKYLDHIIGSDHILRSIKQISEENRLKIIKDLGMLQRYHPGIATAVKTRQAVRTVLNNIKHTVVELKDEGLLDESVYSKLEQALESRMKQLMLAPSYIEPPIASAVLESIPWLAQRSHWLSHLKDHVQLMNMSFGDCITRQGDHSEGIHIIVSGLVKVELQDTQQLIEEVERSGVLPNSELVLNLSSSAEQNHDFVGSGTVLGQVGVLTGRRRDASVTCETDVQTLFLPTEALHELFEQGGQARDSLQYVMWKSVAKQIMVNVLMGLIQFQTWPKEKVRLHVEGCFLPPLDNVTTFTSHDILEDVVLIQGRALNPHTREVYVAPAYIPRSVYQLEMMPTGAADCTTRLAVVVIPEVTQQEIDEHFGPSESTKQLSPSSPFQLGVSSKSTAIYRKRRSSLSVFLAEAQ